AAGVGVFVLSTALGAWLFGADSGPDPSVEPIVIDLDGAREEASTSAPSAVARLRAEATSEAAIVEEVSELPSADETKPRTKQTQGADDEARAPAGAKGKVAERIDRDAVNRVLAEAAEKAAGCGAASGPDGAGKVRV